MTERSTRKPRVLSIAEDARGSDAPDHRTRVGQHRTANTRARIIEAAALVYAEKGPDLPVIDDVVKAAGLSRGTFYNHFRTTDELLSATIDWIDVSLARAIIEAIEPLADVVERAAMGMRLHLHWITSDPGLCAFFARVPQVAEVGRCEARTNLSSGMASGAFVVEHPEAACDLVFGALSETIRRAALSPAQPHYCDAVVTAILLGLGVAGGRVRRVMARPLPQISFPVRPVAGAEVFSASVQPVAPRSS